MFYPGCTLVFFDVLTCICFVRAGCKCNIRLRFIFLCFSDAFRSVISVAACGELFQVAFVCF